MFWAGKKFGFGFYQAGQLVRAFVFRADGQGINDQVPIPHLPGQLIDATCVFSDDLAWFMTRSQVAGKLQNDCYVVDRSGALVATATAIEGEDTWLNSSIRGHLAAGKSLYAATDEGIVQVACDNGSVYVQRTFPDTVSFVSGATTLLPAPSGLYAVSNREITLLEIK
jgi:H/ACA ribonucleoprotein complex subunit 3